MLFSETPKQRYIYVKGNDLPLGLLANVVEDKILLCKSTQHFKIWPVVSEL